MLFRRFLPLLFSLFFSWTSAQTVWHLRLKKYKLAVLDSALKENSGLTFHKGKLITHNDGGNSAEIFEIHPKTGTISRRISLKSKNTDWESITSDGEYLYIGDFGNNKGDRKDLSILKLTLDLTFEEKKIIYFPEQKDFTSGYFKHNYDAEAMIFQGGNFHIFSKEWRRGAVTHYILQPDGNLQQQERYKSRFLVTGAEYSEGKLYLVGYTRKGEVFMLRFSETAPGVFFKAKPRLFFLGMAFNIGQIEAIAANSEGLYISGEKFSFKGIKVPPTLYFVPFEKLK